jgi:hypothetical protein
MAPLSEYNTTARLTTAMASVLTDQGLFQCFALVLPYTGLALTPTCLMRVEPRAVDEPWTVTHLSTGRPICAEAEHLSYDAARRLIRALVALPIDWRAEMPTGAPEVMAEAKQLVKGAKG